jgi:hypothetical protein
MAIIGFDKSDTCAVSAKKGGTLRAVHSALQFQQPVGPTAQSWNRSSLPMGNYWRTLVGVGVIICPVSLPVHKCMNRGPGWQRSCMHVQKTCCMGRKTMTGACMATGPIVNTSVQLSAALWTILPQNYVHGYSIHWLLKGHRMVSTCSGVPVVAIAR